MFSGSRRPLANAASQTAVATSAVSVKTFATKAAPAAASKSSSSSKRSSPLYDLRRLRERSAWKPKPDPNEDIVVFPNERLGNDYDLNWAVCGYGVIPNNELFRNLHLRGLQMLSQGKADENKAVHVTLDPKEADFHHYCVPPPQPTPPPQASPAPGQPAPAAQPASPPPSPPLFSLPSSVQSLNADQYKRLFKEVRKHISNSPNIFVRDGALGSHSLFEEVSRVITSDSETALFLHHSLPPVPVQSDPTKLGESVVAFIAPGLTLNNPGEFGLKSNNFTVIDFVQNKILLGGTRSLEALQQAFAALASYRLAHKGVLPVTGTSVLGADGRPVLAIGSYLPFIPRDELFGCFLHFWTPVGVSRLLNGAITPYTKDSKLSRGDLVLSSQGKASVVTGLSKTVTPSAKHPSKVVFFTETGKPELTKITTEKAVEHYGSSTSKYPISVQPSLLKERFAHLLQEYKVTAYELNVKDKAPAEAKALFQNALK